MNTRSGPSILLVIALAVGACGGSRSSEELVVSAAASLSEVFGELEQEFEAANPDFDLLINYGGSSVLREQILGGAPVAVFASANPENVEAIVAADMASDPITFATNRLVIAVPTENPGGVVGLESFSREELLIGLCAEGVPCGELARAALRRAGVTPAVDTDEPDVRSLLTKIEAGELDAGITYVTDVASAGEVEGIEIPEALNVVAEYQIVVLDDAPEHANRFLAFVLSEQGQAILMSHGFGPR